MLSTLSRTLATRGNSGCVGIVGTAMRDSCHCRVLDQEEEDGLGLLKVQGQAAVQRGGWHHVGGEVLVLGSA